MELQRAHITTSDRARVFMVIENSNFLNRLEANQYSIFTQKFHHSAAKTLSHYEGEIMDQDNNKYLVCFDSATNAVLCALEIEKKFKYVTPKFDKGNRRLKIGLAAEHSGETSPLDLSEAINRATHMCEVVQDRLVISPAVKAMYEKENKNARIDKEHIRTLKQRELIFLERLMAVSKQIWKQGSLSLEHLRSAMGYSRSSFYRQVKKLTGKSPHYFIREFRLQRALNLLHKRKGNITKIASETGFKNASHFAKCFSEEFGLLPSKYTQHHVM